MYGEAEYDTYVETPYRSKRAVATCYFILYIGTVLMLLVNLLIALLVHTYGTRQATAEKVCFGLISLNVLLFLSFLCRVVQRRAVLIRHKVCACARMIPRGVGPYA